MEINNVDVSRLPADVRKQFKQLQVMYAEKKIRNKMGLSHVGVVALVDQVFLGRDVVIQAGFGEA